MKGEAGMSDAIKKSGSEPGMKKHRLLIVISIASILFLVAILAGGIIWLLNVGSRVTVQVPERAATNHETPVSGEHQAEAQAVAQQYMTAFLKRQYSEVWSLLNPQVQAIWLGEAAFAKFWQLRFHDYKVQGFLLGSIHGLSLWVNPETMRAYTQVIVLPISLQIEPKPILLKQAGLPPEDLQPSEVFRDLPFIIQQVSEQNKQQAHWFVLDGGPVDLEAPILPPAQPIHKGVQVPILMYHHISDARPANLLDWSLTVTPAHFSQQLDYLKAHNYHTITFNQLFAALYYNGPLPQHPIILTFDDGYEDAYRFAFPILQAHSFSGMFYIITGVVGWKGYLNWIQVRRMLAEGMQVGSHTIHHVDIGSTLLYSPIVAQEELQLSQARLQRELGVVIQQFCYPSGEPFRHGSLALQQRVVALLAADGYIGATTDPGQTGIIQSSDAPFVLLRIRVDGRESFLEFTASLPWNTK